MLQPGEVDINEKVGNMMSETRVDEKHDGVKGEPAC
jgi:hypothetical protein